VSESVRVQHSLPGNWSYDGHAARARRIPLSPFSPQPLRFGAAFLLLKSELEMPIGLALGNASFM
jgi:hypothetical protein